MMKFLGRVSTPEKASTNNETLTNTSAGPSGPARPIRLVYCDENGKFHMDPEAVALLQLIKEPLGVVSVCGRARQGKSFILNQLLGRSSGFQVASTHWPCTKGLWMWSTPLRRTALDGTQYNLLLLDSEGIDAYDQTGTYSTQIFSLAVLLSSMFIYNQMGGIDEAALDRLSLVTEMTKHIRVRASGGKSTATELAQFSPIFVWLLRDFYLELAEGNRKITPRDYLEVALRSVEGAKKDVASKNEIRESIRALFPDRECFQLVRPLSNENELRRLDQIPIEKLRPEFRAGLDALTRFVFERTRPKQVGGTVMTGPIFARITQSFLDALNNGAVPTITSSWQSVEEGECQRAYELGTEVYMNSFDRSKPPEEAALGEAHEDAVQKSMAAFNSTAVGTGSIRQKYEKRLHTFLKKSFEDIKKDVFREAYLLCMSTTENMERELRKACHAPEATVDTILKVLDELLSKYETTCHGPEKWGKAILFLQQSLEGPVLDFIKKQIDQIGSEKSSLALKCRSTEDRISLLNKKLEASEKYKSEYLKRYEDAFSDKKNLAEEYMGRITNLQKKCSSTEEKCSNLSKTVDAASQESRDWKRKYEVALSKKKAEEERYSAEFTMLTSKSSAAEARLAAAQEKAQSAKEEAEEWKRKYDIAARDTKNTLEKATGIQERMSYQTQTKEAALRAELSTALVEKDREIQEKGTKIEQSEQRLMTLSLELKAAESKIESYNLEISTLKLEMKELIEKVENANATALSGENKAWILEKEKIHLEQKYQSQFIKFKELNERCKTSEKEAKRVTEVADEARAEAASAQKDKTDFQRIAMERLAQIERAERQADTLVRQTSDLTSEVERYRAAEKDALCKVELLEEKVREREKELNSLLASNNSQRKNTVALLESLLESERVAHAEAGTRAENLSVKLQSTQAKLDELTQDLNALRFGEKKSLDGKLKSGLLAKRVNMDDYEMGVNSVHYMSTNDNRAAKANKRSKSNRSLFNLNTPEDDGSVYRGDELTSSQQTNTEDYTKFTIRKLRQSISDHNFGDQLLQLDKKKNPLKKDYVSLYERTVLQKLQGLEVNMLWNH